MPLQILNPVEFPRWDESLRSLPGRSFFHTSFWAETLQSSYSYPPCYFTFREGDVLSALLPCMSVESRLTGKRGVCLPFTDYCEPVVSKGSPFHELFAAAIDFGKKRRWQSLEIRGGESFFSNEKPSEWHYGHTLDLAAGSREIFAGLRDSTRRNIRKAEKEGVETAVSVSPEAVEDFCRLNALTRREHGLPPQPRRFFRNMFDHVLSHGRGFVVLASSRGVAVAANVYFHFDGTLLYKYGASDRAFQHLRANNLVMWEAIRWGCDHGCRTLCFGRTEPQNVGLRQFKAGWGAREHVIRYYRYDLTKGAFIEAPLIVRPVYRKIFSSLPVPALNLLGRVLYRHMG